MRHAHTFALLALLASACGEAPHAAAAPRPTVTLVSREPLVVAAEIATDGPRMAYDVTSFEVPEGAEVRLTFRNAGSAEKPMFHNWVLVARGHEQDVLQLGLLAGYEHAWVPEHPAVLAATGALRPGEEEHIVFAAPPAGSYPYVCSVPGHTAMCGRMIVRRAERAGRR